MYGQVRVQWWFPRPWREGIVEQHFSAEDIRDVAGHSARFQHQPLRDLLVGHAAADQLRCFLLSRREHKLLCRCGDVLGCATCSGGDHNGPSLEVAVDVACDD